MSEPKNQCDMGAPSRESAVTALRDRAKRLHAEAVGFDELADALEYKFEVGSRAEETLWRLAVRTI